MHVPVVIDDLDDEADVVDVGGGHVEGERLVVDGTEAGALDARALLADALAVTYKVHLHVRVCNIPHHYVTNIHSISYYTGCLLKNSLI